MRRADVVADLKQCVAKKTNMYWFGERGIRSLYPGIDAKLVERAMRIILPWHACHACRRLPDEYVPIAQRILAKAHSTEATFLTAYDGDLRDGCDWLFDAHMIDPKRRDRLVKLCRDPDALAAARTTVVAHGTAFPQLLAVLAHDGHADSIDALVDLVEARDRKLDDLMAWFVPFAKTPRMKALAADLVAASDARGAASPLQALAKRFGAKPNAKFFFEVAVESREVRMGLVRKATAWIVLSSHALPNASASITWNLTNHLATRWSDGKKIRDENKLGVPKSVDDIPRWIAASATKLKIRWDPEAMRVSSTLRGKSRDAAVTWLLG